MKGKFLFNLIMLILSALLLASALYDWIANDEFNLNLITAILLVIVFSLNTYRERKNMRNDEV